MIHIRLFLMFTLLAGLVPSVRGEEFRRLPVGQYRDRMKAGWIGQIIGVSWGAPTEGRYRQIMPADKMPPFRETLANDAFDQDDLYVEMTFLRSMEQYGLDVSQRQAGIDFANSGYPLWVANDAGRKNLRNGIAPPDSSHPKFHKCAGAIDYQIESDFAGLIAPGMPNTVVALGEKFGRLMNYGDGMYAGQFMGAMYAEAFFETDVEKLIAAGLAAIPAESRYAEMVRDMLRWHREDPKDWEKTWAKVDKKYRSKEYYVSALDVKLEGAFVLMGLLYGDRDPDRTIIIACRCGSDSDCNPSSAGGVLCTSIGLANLTDRYYRKLDQKRIFNHTAYNFPSLVAVCEKLARQALVKEGGRVEKDAQSEEVFIIPVKKPVPCKFEDLLKPGPIADSRFTEAEKAQITAPSSDKLLKIKLLMVYNGGHDFQSFKTIMTEALAKTGRFEVTVAKDLDALRIDNLKRFNEVLFYGSGGDFTDPAQEKGLAEFVEGGGAMAGVHATDAHKKSDVYWRLIGGRFTTHGGGKFTVYLTGKHPIIAGMKDFEITDETYQNQMHPKAKVECLGRMNRGNEKQCMVWVQQVGRGRVFNTTLGHGREAFVNPEFQRLVIRGLEWAAGREPKDP